MKNWEPLVSGPAFAIDKSPIHKSKKKIHISSPLTVVQLEISIILAKGQLKNQMTEEKRREVQGVHNVPGPVCFSLKFSSANFSP